MLQSYPIKINGTAIYNPEGYSESSDVVETVNESESGTDIIILTRKDKLTISLSFRCSSYFKAILEGYRNTEPLSVQVYDATEDGYKTRSMRIRNYTCTLVQDSWKTRNTNGLYEISFDLVEY